MTKQLYQPFIGTMMAPGNAAAPHGAITIDLLDVTNGISIALVDDAYAFDLTDIWFDELTTNVVSSGTAALVGTSLVTSTNGYALDGTDLTGANQMTGVGDGTEAVDIIVFYDNQGASGGADPLIGFTDEGTGFSFIPNSSTVEITWAGSPNYIFSIGV